MRRRAAAALLLISVASATVAAAAPTAMPDPPAATTPVEASPALPVASAGLEVPIAALRYFKSNSPPYPEAARRYGLEGGVATVLNLDTEGRVTCSVAETSGYALLDGALREWCAAAPKFEPARRNGVPEPFWFKIRYGFRLEGGGTEGTCTKLGDYAKPLPGERGKLIEALAALDPERLEAARKEAHELGVEFVRRLTQGFNRLTPEEGWPIANATPREVMAWLEERRAPLEQRFSEAANRHLAAEGWHLTVLLQRRRCIFDQLTLAELQAADAFQRAPEGRAVIRSAQLAGERLGTGTRWAVRYSGMTAADELMRDIEVAFPGFREALHPLLRVLPAE